MELNFPIIFLAALMPMLVGFIWYHNKVFGKSWMSINGFTEEQLKTGNMAVIFGVSYLFSIMLAMALLGIVIHQFTVMSILADEPGMKDPQSEVSLWFKDFMEKYGRNFRTFKHGAFHGFLSGLFIALPIVGINALFERRGWKYIFIHTGYWALTLMLMGGILCAWG